jgi:predicted Zn-dependent protease
MPTTIEDKNGNVFEVNEKGEVRQKGSSDTDLDEVIISGLADNYEIVVNDDVNKATTDRKLTLVYEQQKINMILQKNNGDSIKVANIQWIIQNGKKATIDSTLTQEFTITDEDIEVTIYEKITDEKGKQKKAKIAEFAFVVKQSPYVTFSTLSNYDGEFGFDDGEDFKENSFPKINNHYETISITDSKGKTTKKYIPWLTIKQGQPAALLKMNFKEKEVSGDSIYLESTSRDINVSLFDKTVSITNNSLVNDFTTPEYVNIYRDDKYGLQKKMLIGRIAVVGMYKKTPINVQVIYYAKDTTKIREVLDITLLNIQLNDKSLNQSFMSFNAMNSIKILDTLSNSIANDKLTIYKAIKNHCIQKGLNETIGTLPNTVYIVMTEYKFKGDGGTGCARGGVLSKNNVAIIWSIDKSECKDENIYKLITHEIGHTLGLDDVFNDNAIGNPERGFSRNNYMDYSTENKTLNRTMYFKSQIQEILDKF